MLERLLYNCWGGGGGGELRPVLQSVARLELFTLLGLMSVFLVRTFTLLVSTTGVEVTRPPGDSESRELGGSWEGGGLPVTPSVWKLERVKINYTKWVRRGKSKE